MDNLRVVLFLLQKNRRVDSLSHQCYYLWETRTDDSNDDDDDGGVVVVVSLFHFPPFILFFSDSFSSVLRSVVT